ncbi:phage tail tape measure protein [Hafnia paralvei]|uniref:phage tail tape measure protein n=1 Tax=Hafnia paralvei TaxID=546367 RepID=UPI002FDB9D44
MADEIGKISLVADTSSLERATNELDKFTVSGNKAATAADSLNDSNAKTAAKVKDVNASFAAGSAIREQVRRSYEGTTKELQGLQRELVAIRGRVDPVGAAFDNLAQMSDKLREGLRQGLIDPSDYAASVKGIDKLTSSLERSVYESTAAGKAAKEAAQADKLATVAKESFISRLREQAETQGKTNSEILAYKAAQLGATQEAAPFIASLKQQEDAWKNGAISSGQYRQALRQLPAQFTDIFTSIAGGMPIWMVFMQQGGQISDSFGGIGSLFEVIKREILGFKDASDDSNDSLSESANGLAENAENGKKFLGFLTPARLAIGGVTATIAALGVAYYQGSKENEEYNKQIILTGNYAGVTTDRLNEMAKTISKSGGTQGAAAAALAKIVGTGAFDSRQLEGITRAAVAMEDATGQSVDATIANFKRLKDDPLRAAQDLDKQLHFLTATQLESITKLSETGNVTAAARVAMDAYADTMQQRAADVTDSLGYLETGWNSIKSIASSAWDAMLGVGREDTIEDKIERLQKASKARALGMADVNVGVDTSAEIATLQEEKFQRDIKVAKDKAEQNEQDRQKREYNATQALNKKYETEKEKHLRTIREIENGFATKEAKDTAIARENKRFAESQARKTKKPKAEKAFTDDAATKELAASQQRLAVLRGQSSITDKMTQQESRLLEFNQQIADLKSKSILTADQKSLLSRESEIRASLQLEANIAKENAQRDKAVKAMKTMSDYAKEIEERNKQAEKSFGKTTKGTQREAQESQLKKTYNKSLEGITDPAQLEKIAAEYVRARDKLHEGFRDEDARESDWISGLNMGINQFAENSLNVFQATAQIGQTTMQSLSDMATDLASTGKANIKEFGTSILKMILQVINQLLVAYAIQSALRWMSGGASFSSTGLNDGTKGIPMPPKFDAGGYTGDGGKYEPKGIVHGGEFVFTKESTSRIGTDNLYALMRGYANGGLVGGASTDRAPMLGLQGGGSASGPIIQTSVVVNSEGGQQQRGGNSDALGKAYQQVIDTSVRDGISKALRPGGLIWMAQNKR